MEEGGVDLREELRAELRELVRAALGLVEQHRDAGTSGFPKRARAVAARVPGSDAGLRTPDPAPQVAPTRASLPPSGAEQPASMAFVGASPPPSSEPPSSTWREEDGSRPERISTADRETFVVPTADRAARVRLPVAEIVPPEERAARLTLVAETVRGCLACELAKTRRNTVFSRGNPAAELFFIGEGPGADEDETGVPFVGKAGQLLDKMILAMGYRLDDVYICNIVKCRPPENRKPAPEEIAACSGYLREQLMLVSPKVIVTLGATALEGLFGGPQGGITRVRGQWRVYQAKVPVMPTFHPAYLLRNPDAKKDVWADLQAVLARLGKKPPGRAG